MEATIASAPGHRGRNEDWAAAATTGVAVVLDGLTAVGDDSGCRHGTPWYVQQLGARLLRYAGDSGCPLREVLAESIAGVARLHRDTCDPAAPTAPGATVAIVRFTGMRAEYLVLSDAVAVLDTGGEPVVATDDSARRHVADLAAAANTAGRDGGAALTALIRAQQRLRNTPGGYWVAQAAPEAAGYALTGEVEPATGALLLSDGAALMVTDFGAASWRELLDLGYTAGPAGIIAATRELAARDPDGVVWPRYKPHDDATAVLCRPAG